MVDRKNTQAAQQFEALQAQALLTITTERIDDLPLLVGHMDRMGLSDLLDEHFPTHGHWQGLSLGRLTTTWLAHILSQADHRMKYAKAMGWSAP